MHLLKELLERIMPDRKIRELRLCDGSNTELQKTIITGIITKNVRLDVLFEDDNTWFDIEIQTSSDIDLPLRGRYYSSAMYIDQIKQGTKYRQLKHSYVIFICTLLSVSPRQLKLGRKGNTSDWRRKLMTLEEKMNDLFAEGEAKKNLENAKKMRDEGLSTDLISRITGLSEEAIEAL